jgi:hypothetical protein
MRVFGFHRNADERHKVRWQLDRLPGIGGFGTASQQNIAPLQIGRKRKLPRVPEPVRQVICGPRVFHHLHPKQSD